MAAAGAWRLWRAVGWGWTALLSLAATLWLLLFLLIIWLADGAPRIGGGKYVPYISDVGARHETVFIVGCALVLPATALQLGIFVPQQKRRVRKCGLRWRGWDTALAAAALVFAAAAWVLLVLLAVFDNIDDNTAHAPLAWTFFGLFGASVVLITFHLWVLRWRARRASRCTLPTAAAAAPTVQRDAAAAPPSTATLQPAAAAAPPPPPHATAAAAGANPIAAAADNGDQATAAATTTHRHHLDQQQQQQLARFYTRAAAAVTVPTVACIIFAAILIVAVIECRIRKGTSDAPNCNVEYTIVSSMEWAIAFGYSFFLGLLFFAMRPFGSSEVGPRGIGDDSAGGGRRGEGGGGEGWRGDSVAAEEEDNTPPPSAVNIV